MGFASAFASGLIKGFNQNILREQDKILISVLLRMVIMPEKRELAHRSLVELKKVIQIH